MVRPGHHWRYTIEDYVALEERTELKHEFLDGQIFAMGGGTPEHAAMAIEVATALRVQLRGRPCRVYSSDLRIRVVATGLDTYPDVSVVCGHEARDREDSNALVNPIALVEVTSRSSEDYDRGDKLDQYRSIESLREVVIVSHREVLVEVWSRGEDGIWSSRAWRAGEIARLPALGCSLTVDELYANPLVD